MTEATNENTLPARKDVPQEHTWDAASVFPSDEAWEKELERLRARLPKLERFRGSLAEGPEVLAAWLALREELHEGVDKIDAYGTLRFAVAVDDEQAAAIQQRARALHAQFHAAASFAEPEMLAIGGERLLQWAEGHPDLSVYRHYFDTLARRAPYVGTPEVERLLQLVEDPFRTAVSAHSISYSADMTFPDVVDGEGNKRPLHQGNAARLMNGSDRTLRRSAWEAYTGAFLGLKNSLSQLLAAGVKQNVFMAKARGYASALEAALAQNHIPTAVFQNTIDTYREHLPVWHRYWDVRRRALGLEKLHRFDTRAPLTEREPRVSYEQAVDWIVAGVAPLGSDYAEVLLRGCLQQRWVDRYPNKGKRSGAFSAGTYGTHPFILLNFGDVLISMSTLAHELGHSMHSYYARKHQPRLYAEYGVFVAEVASNFNQALVRAHLFEVNRDRDFQIALVEEAISNFHRYFFIMPTLARFELELHRRVEQNEPLTEAYTSGLMADLFEEAYGPAVEPDRERIGITWAQFPVHLYLNFYVYQYATGIAGAHALARPVLDGKPGAAEAYLDFLKAGGSDYPLEVLRKAGVDMESPEPVAEAFRVLESLIQRLETLLEAPDGSEGPPRAEHPQNSGMP